MYGRGKVTGPRHPHHPRRTADAALVRDIVASIRQRDAEGRPWTLAEYMRRPEIVEAVRDALRKDALHA